MTAIPRLSRRLLAVMAARPASTNRADALSPDPEGVARALVGWAPP